MKILGSLVLKFEFAFPAATSAGKVGVQVYLGASQEIFLGFAFRPSHRLKLRQMFQAYRVTPDQIVRVITNYLDDLVLQLSSAGHLTSIDAGSIPEDGLHDGSDFARLKRIFK